MAEVTGFIEVTALSDGRKCLIRADQVDAVYDYGEQKLEYGIKPAHTEICYGGHGVDVSESYEEVKDKLWRADL